MSRVIALSLTASLNPTLVAATTVMLLLPRPKKLMLGYLCGALVTSITLGLVIVSSLSSSSTTSTAKNVLSPAADLALGAIALTFASVVYTGRHEGLSERRRARKAAKPDKGPPRWQRELSKGSARTTFIVGVVLSLPGASYLAGRENRAEQALGQPARPKVRGGRLRDDRRAAGDQGARRPGLIAGRPRWQRTLTPFG